MSLDLHLVAIWLAAYAAAGTLYVLPGLIEAWSSVAKGELSGLCLVALCWLLITLVSLITLRRTRRLSAVLARFHAETVRPLALLLSIVVAASSLLAA